MILMRSSTTSASPVRASQTSARHDATDRLRIYPKKTSKDKVLGKAVEVARTALSETIRDHSVGEHVGVASEGEHILTHCFECLMPGYRGWYWAVTLVRLPRSRHVTIDEIALRPGEDALLAPAWVPWAERLEPSDISPTDRLPYRADDPRLIQNYEESGEDADQMEYYEMGHGRARTLSPLGRKLAFERWYEGEAGPHTAGTRSARATCASCGFLMLMAGSARTLFGVCANEWARDDGRVVSFDHGCGSHSETDVAHTHKMWDPVDPVIDETRLDTRMDVDDAF